MKKLLYVCAVLAVLVTSLPVGVPVSAAPGNMMFAAQAQPTNTGLKVVSGSDIADIAVSTNGTAIYVVDKGGAGRIYRSTDGGMTFNAVTAPEPTLFYQHIGVASDSPDAIVVSNGARVFTSANGGASWTELPAPVVAATHTVTSVAVAPARSGTLLGREYAVSVANNTTGVVTGGDVLVIGGLASWASVGVSANTRDYMAVKFSPAFLLERSVVALGSTAAAGGVAVQVFNTEFSTLVASAVLPAVVPSTIDFSTAPAGANIIRGSLALPANFDATTAAGRRSYAGLAAFSRAGGITTDNDVYRVDDTIATRLSAFPGAGVFSVSYAGTIDTGTLFMGRESTNEVRYTTNPTSASPTWTATRKLLPIAPIPATVAAGFEPRNTIVVASSSFATNSTVYAGTSGVESGFSVSTNGGLTFNQTAIIDNQTAGATINTVGINEGPAIATPDGRSLFIAARVNTGSGTTAERWLSLWRSPAPVDSGTWTRVMVVASADLFAANNGRARVKLSPDFATTSTLYFMDLALNGVFYRSTDGGDIYASRLTPAGIAPANDVEEDANIIYISDGGPPTSQGVNVYKSTTGGWTWQSPTSPGVGPVRSLVIGKPGELLVGGLGNIAYSRDGGLTFTRYAGASAGDSYRIAKDADFATNSTIYLADATGAPGGTGGVYRYVIGTSAAFEDLGEAVANPGLGAGVGFGLRDGVLYNLHPNLGVTRTLFPLAPAGQQQWQLLNVPAGGPQFAATSMSVTSPANTVYLRDGAQGLWAMYDYLAAARPRITSPADNTTVPVDPVNGRAELVTLIIEPMGTGPGLVGQYEVEIAERSAGWATGVRSGGITVTDPTSPAILIGATAPSPMSGGFWYVMSANKAYMLRVRAFAEISGEDATSPWSDPINLFVSAIQPVVTTGNATSVTGNSALLNGVLNDPGAWPAVSVGFEWGLTTQYGSMTSPVSMNATGPFSFNLTGLAPNTTYHFRARALGTAARFIASVPSYGADRTFTTSAVPPTVTTGSATNLTASSATLNGVLDNLGSATTVIRSFEVGLTTAYGTTTTPVATNSTGPFSFTVTGLSPSTTYHFRTKAVGDGTGYGADRTFVTPLTTSPLSLTRRLPALVSRGQIFAVSVNFTAPSDNFTSLGLTDFAPAGWSVSANRLGFAPPADVENTAGNRVEYLWYSGNYTGGTAFVVSYNVTVPAAATPGLYSFTGGFLEYNNGAGIGPFIADIGGDGQVQVPMIEGSTYGANGVVMTSVTVTLDSTISGVSDSAGVYRIGTAATGSHTLVASKTGFRSQTQTLNVPATGVIYTLDFKGNSGLVPNAPDLSYVLACINRWKFDPMDGTGLSLSKVLSAINAWKFPI